MLKVITGIFLVCSFSFGQHFGDEAIYTINGKKALHSVSEKFLSVTIDPAILLTGLNLSDTSFQLAKHLSPAFIRIAGPSTQFVKYEDFPSNEQTENTANVVVTPTMWFGINEWLNSANLTPIFGINDEETSKGEWNPQSTMPLLDISDKFNLSCYWQLGYDCSNKTEEQYKGDLKRFHNILEAFPNKKDTWKIVGSDLNKCVTNNYTETSRRVLEDLEGIIAATVWEPTTRSESSFLEEHLTGRLLAFPIKPRVPIWITSPKTHHPVSFSSAISWAEQIGQAAKIGYEVIFRQPRLHEIFSVTPPFWVSFLHKAMMGRTVLEVKATGFSPQVSVYAHCSRHQNNFIRSGAMTVFMVNNSTKNHTIFLRFGTVLLRNIEVQSYILTAPSEEATEVFLNGEKLRNINFTEDKMNILPKLRRAKIMNYLSLSLPPKSVGFFVLPAARVPVCIDEENDMKLIMEEINEDQKIPFSEEVSAEIAPRFFANKAPTLWELRHEMEKELESDEQYHKEVKKHLLPIIKSENTERRSFFGGERVKASPKRIFELELTSAEIRRVLADRAKVKAAKKNIIFTSEELEEIMEKATEKILNNKNTSIRIKKKTKREAERDKKDINTRLLRLKTLGDKRRLLMKQLIERPKEQKREKRDINMDLLKIKTDFLHNKNKKPIRSRFENNEEKEATIRGDYDTSADFAEDYVEEKESPLPDGDVFAELADDDFFTTTTEKSRFSSLKIKSKPVFKLPNLKPTIPKSPPKPKMVVMDDYEHSIEDIEDDIGNFDCIHEYAGGNFGKIDTKKKVSELWEVGVESVEEKKQNHLPTLTNRALIVEEEGEKDDIDTFEDDYGDLESNESNPVRLKRAVNETDKIDETLKRILKDRFAYKKKLNLINKNNHMSLKRVTRGLYLKPIKERYQSLTKNLKIWKPSDILTLKNGNSKKSKRSAGNYVNSVENEIDNFMHEIAKDPKIIEPKLDMENGDYQMVFPNKDKIEVLEKKGDTELKLLIHGNKDDESNIQRITKEYDNNVWKELFEKVTKFFQKLSVKLKNYVFDDLLKQS